MASVTEENSSASTKEVDAQLLREESQATSVQKETSVKRSHKTGLSSHIGFPSFSSLTSALPLKRGSRTPPSISNVDPPSSPSLNKSASVSALPSPGLAPDRKRQKTEATAEFSSAPDLLAVPSSEGPGSPRRSSSIDSLLYHTESANSLSHDNSSFSHVKEASNMKARMIRETIMDFHTNQDEEALDRVLETLTGDVVILGGIKGSSLISTEPPYRNRWEPLKVGLNMRKEDLEVGWSDEAEETMEETMKPGGMLEAIGPFDISRRLFRKIRSSKNYKAGTLRVWNFGYDWRLSPRIASRKLIEFLKTLPSNQQPPSSTASSSYEVPEDRGAFVIAHSLGGLVTRNAVNQNPELFAGVVYAGVPQHCCLIFGAFRDGEVVIFNNTTFSARVNFSFRSCFIFMPEEEDDPIFLNKDTGKPYRMDFYDPQNWLPYRFSPMVAPVLPDYYPKPQPTGLTSYLPSFPFKWLVKGSNGNNNTRKENQGTADITPARVLDSIPNAAGLPTTLQANASTANTTTNVVSSRSSSVSASSQPSSTASNFSSSGGSTPSSEFGEGDTNDGKSVNSDSDDDSSDPPPPLPTGDDAPSPEVMDYLTRALAQAKEFRRGLLFRPEHHDANRYPPASLMFGKDHPTISSVNLASAAHIACSDAYNDMNFSRGDGVVLAKAAMLPKGYSVVKNGLIVTDRTHMTMLSDMKSVGMALEAIVEGRKRGIGRGKKVQV